MISKILSLIILSFFVYGCRSTETIETTTPAMQTEENNNEAIDEFRGMLDELIHSNDE